MITFFVALIYLPFPFLPHQCSDFCYRGPSCYFPAFTSNTDYDGSSDSNNGQASDGSKATGKRGKKGRVERAQDRMSPQASPVGGSLASGRAARKTGRATGTAPESVDEAHRAASLLVAMRPSIPKAVEAEASHEFSTGGVGTKGEGGGVKGRRRKVSAPADSPESGASAKGKASGGGEMGSGGRIGNIEYGKDGGKKRRKTSDVSDSNTPDIGGLMAKTGDGKKGKKKQQKKMPVEVSTSKGGGTGSSTSSGGSNGTKVTDKRKGKERKEGIGGKGRGVRDGGRDGKGPGDGTKKEEISHEKRPKELEELVRVAFSGLSPADRQVFFILPVWCHRM